MTKRKLHENRPNLIILISILLIVLIPAVVSAADPVIDPIPTQYGTVGSLVSFTVNATNPNAGTLTFGLNETAPAGSSMNLTTGEFTWTPSATGTYDFNVTVNDTVVPTVSSPVTIIVTAGGDTVPPASVTNLVNTTYLQNSINWSWTDPPDADFDHVEIYLDTVFQANVTKGVMFYDATGLLPDTLYLIGTKTVDTSGNVNATTITDAQRTAPAAGTGQPPVITMLGRNPASISNGSTAYYDAGAMASDPEDGNLTALINVTSDVNVGVAGSYSVVYTVTDTGGNTVNATRSVTVANRLDPGAIPKFQSPLIIPPEMPKTAQADPNIDYYEIAVREFQQQILPAGMPNTTVWSYGSATTAGTFNYPAFTIEATYNRTTKVKWINELVDVNGSYLPHLLPIDQTLHWANPPGGIMGRDMHGTDPNPYMGPVPAIIHVHGAHTYQESDGYPEGWYLPAANNIPAGYATTGTYYDTFKANATFGAEWVPGSAVFEYPNHQRATTLWYHDHSLGMTRTNVYTGPAGFYLLRSGPDDMNLGFNRPGTTLNVGVNPADVITEIPLAIQDRSFNDDGSLFYPDSRAFFDGFTGPYAPTSDIAPIWNPEFFGDTIVVNGNTWPYQDVQQRQYRLRILNGDQARFLILNMSNGMNFTQIGTEGGFLPQPVSLNQLLIGPAERADVIVDFTGFPVGTNITMQNIGPDSPFGGGVPGIDFPIANTTTTGQVMQFRVTSAAVSDPSIPAGSLVLPAMANLGPGNYIRNVSLNEVDSATIIDPGTGLPFGPRAALLGTVMFNATAGMPMGMPMMWMDAITENINQRDTEIWQIYDFTMDAHPIHIHQVQFQVVNREIFDPMVGTPGTIIPRESWETGYKDTVIVYPGQLTRVKARFDLPGLFVWHCHILEHEDNEMMRPYQVLPRDFGKGVFRPSAAYNWILDRSMDGTVDVRNHYGNQNDTPLIGDFNNDGVTDRAVFRPSVTNNWIIDYGMNGVVDTRNPYGMKGDIPLIGDFNNDGAIDRAVFRFNTSNNWIFDYGMDGSVDTRNNYGMAGDIPFVGDFNNDGVTDRAVFRPSVPNNWIIDYGMNGIVDTRNHYGMAGDIPFVGDFNNDGSTDRAVFRKGEWIIDYNIDGSIDSRPMFGQAGDIPVFWSV